MMNRFNVGFHKSRPTTACGVDMRGSLFRELM